MLRVNDIEIVTEEVTTTFSTSLGAVSSRPPGVGVPPNGLLRKYIWWQCP